MKYSTITYSRRTPQAKMQRILTSAPVAPPAPPTPTVYYLVSGTLTENGSIPSFSAGIEFSSLGTYFTAASGSYGLLVAQGYSGLALPHYPLGDFTPPTRTYVSVGTDIPNQDYDYVPYPPQPDLLITGQVRLDGTAVSGAQVNLSGSAAAFSAVSGTYVGTVAYGYSGTGALQGYSLPSYVVTPSARVYTGLAVSQAGQDYDIETQLWSIDGVITNNGTGVAIGINDGTNFWTSDASGSYGLVALGGWSGTVRPTTYISAPDAYVYVSIGSDYTAQDFDVTAPVLFVADSNMSWFSWPLAYPDRWFVIAKNPDDLTLSVWGTTAGTITSVDTAPDYGTYYSVYGVNGASEQNTFRSNEQLSSPPLPPMVTLSGSVFDAVYGNGFSQNLYVDTVGTINTDGAGLWTQIVASPFTGDVYPVDIPVDGTFQPTYRSYAALGTDVFDQDFVFVPTPTYLISGTVTPGFVTGIEFTGIGTIFTAASGSYGQQVVQGYSGTATPHATPDVFAPVQRFYSNVVADTPNQDYTYTLPFFAVVGEIRLDGVPTLGISVTFPGDGQGTSDSSGTYSGNLVYGYTGTASVLDYTGTDYIITPPVRVYTNLTGPLAGQDYDIASQFFTISGSLTDGVSPMAGIGVELTSHGTLITDGTGVYSQIVSTGYSGTGIPHYSGGTFDPDLRVYTNVLSEQPNQNYVFYGTGTVAPTDCPVVSTLATIPINTDPKNPSRNVIDPVNNLLWVIDDTYSNVYYIDVVAGTHLGTLDLGFGVGSPGIVYDSVNQKIVVSSYTGSLAFINPVTKAVTYSNFAQTTPAIHCLAVDQAGTIYVADSADNVTGNVYVVNGASEQLTATYPLGPDSIFTYSICWAENINQLVINNSVAFSTLFYLLDTSNGNFAASVASSGSFAYTESYYVFATGDVLMGANNATTIAVIDISLGTNGTASMQLPADIDNGAPMRLGDATEDTCANTLFVSDAEYAVWEYTLDGNYTLLNCFANGYLGLNQVGLSHSRATNQVYYENYVDGTTYSVPYAQYVISGTATEGGVGLYNVDMEFTTFGTATSTDLSGSYYLTVPVEWSGTVIPHYPAGTFAPASRVYTNVGTDYPNQDYEYFWGGYLFLTEGVTGFVWPSLPSDVVVVDNGGTIVQLHGDNYVYTSTVGRSDWTLRGYAQDGYAITYDAVPNRYVVVGVSGAIWTAEDLSVWYSRTSGVGANTLTSVAYGNGRYVAVGETGVTTMSTDGTTWAASTAGTLQFTDVYYNGTLFVAIGAENQGHVTCYTSDFGTTWTHQDAPDYGWRCGAYSPELGLNIIVGETGAIATSPDAVTWTDYTGAIATVEYLAGVAWGNNRFVITDGEGFVWTSANGTVWDYVTDDPFFRIGRGAFYWKNDWFIITENYPPT